MIEISSNPVIELRHGRKAPMLSGEAVCTVISKNYLAYARVLARSLAHYHPELSLVVCLADRVEGCFNRAAEPFEVVTLEELGNIPELPHFCFKYNALELNTALKPFFFEYLLRTRGLQKLVYCDPDTVFFSGLEDAWELLNRHSMLLTPHITEPYPDQSLPDERLINQAGLFNLGFLGLSNRPQTLGFLSWWQKKLYSEGYLDPEQGMFVDQKWMNFAVVMLEDAHILRNPRYNLAYWNLHQNRSLHLDKGRLFVNSLPAVFYHFSGFDPEDPQTLSRHQDRYQPGDLPGLQVLFSDYASRLLSEGISRSRELPLYYDHFENGTRIPSAARRLYRGLGAKSAVYGNPFHCGKNSFFERLNQPLVPGARWPRLTFLAKAIHDHRRDLQRLFPEPCGRDRAAYTAWLAGRGGREEGLDSVFLEAVTGRCKRRFRDIFPVSFHPRALAHLFFEKAWFFRRDALLLFRRLVDGIERKISAGRRTGRAFGVNVAGYLRGEFGIGESGRALVHALEAARIPHARINVGEPSHRHRDASLKGFQKGNPYCFNLVHINPDSTHDFWARRPAAFSRARKNIGVWYWEMPFFPALWKDTGRYYREIWTATGFVRDAIARTCEVPVIRMPFPVVAPSGRATREALEWPDKDFIFFFFFDYLSIFERKNPLGLIEAFRCAFDGRPGVHLCIKTINRHFAEAEAAKLQEAAARVPGVSIRDGHVPPETMGAMLHACDAYVSLHRSEGLGLGMAQAMALGKPVVATGYSGNMDFMTPANSFPVGFRMERLERDYGPYARGNVWASPDLDEAARLMRAVVEHPENAEKHALQAAQDMALGWSPEACGRAILKRLERLSSAVDIQKPLSLSKNI